MSIPSISCVYFSPTGTKAIAKSIAQGMKAEHIRMVDSTKRSQRKKHALTFHNEVVILAAIVYYGRVFEEVASYYSTFIAEQTSVVLVVVYGNRGFEDALKELQDIAVTQGFFPVAQSAFIAEHSYSASIYPIAHGRPDNKDLKKAEGFGAAVREKRLSFDSIEDMAAITVPGQNSLY
jgi:flavodoxin